MRSKNSNGLPFLGHPLYGWAMVAPSFARLDTEYLRLTDHDVADPPRPEDLVRHPAPLSPVLSGELDGAAQALDSSAEELLLAALARTIGRTIGTGTVVVGLADHGPLALACATEKTISATDLLTGVRTSLGARTPAAGGAREIAVTFSGPVLELPDSPCHAIELRIHRRHDRVHLDWWYDPARFYPYTVVELAEQFPLALIEVCSEATVPSVPRPARSLICTAP